jgi:PAS domain S-box-containing protein
MTISKTIGSEVKKRGVFLARQLAKDLASPILTSDILDVQLLVIEAAESEEPIEYIFVLDRDDKVLAHSFKEGFPEELIEKTILGAGQDYSIQRLNTERGIIFDIGVPILKDGLGSVHMGISEVYINNSVADIINPLSLTIVAFLIVGGVIISVFVFSITNPIRKLTEATDALGRGRFDGNIKIKSKDEIGKLSESFIKMAEDLKTVDKELREREKEATERSRFIESIVNLSPDILYIYDIVEKRNIYSNDGTERILGYTSEEVREMGDTLLPTLMHPDDFNSYLNDTLPEYSRVRDGEIISHVFRMKNKSGEWHWLNCREIIYKREPDGVPRQILGVIHDITERKQAEDLIVRSESFLAESQKIANVGSWEWDIGTNEVNWSDETFRLAGHEPRSFKPKVEDFRSMLHEDDRKAVFKLIEDTLEGRADYFINHRIVLPDGEIRYMVTQGEVQRDTDGRPVRMVGTMLDVTEQRRLEEQLRQSTKLDAIGTLAGGIAHDFNNMLHAILGYAELLESKLAKNETLRAYVNMIITTTERAANLTQSLLAYGRKQIIQFKPTDIHTVILNMEKLLSRFIGEGIEIEMNLPEKPLFIMADSHQIEQVLMNLAINAKDAMPNGGHFVINSETIAMDNEFIKVSGFGKPGEYVKITVTDNGLGMDRATRERIFEPFFTTKEYGGGTGLGLSVIYGIIKQNNGYIDVYSELGEGTTFSIFLPLIDQAIKEDAFELDLPIRDGTETVLLAEDDEQIRWLLKSALEQYKYRVIDTVDGEDAISEFTKNKDDINLSLLDVIMPKKNGIEVYEAIKKFKPDSKVVFMSGYPADYLEKKGLRQKEILISKPVAPSVVLRTIRDVLDK